jgi:hypothetical protein
MTMRRTDLPYRVSIRWVVPEDEFKRLLNLPKDVQILEVNYVFNEIEVLTTKERP